MDQINNSPRLSSFLILPVALLISVFFASSWVPDGDRSWLDVFLTLAPPFVALSILVEKYRRGEPHPLLFFAGFFGSVVWLGLSIFALFTATSVSGALAALFGLFCLPLFLLSLRNFPQLDRALGWRLILWTMVYLVLMPMLWGVVSPSARVV
jgi:hypothetical protein